MSQEVTNSAAVSPSILAVADAQLAYTLSGSAEAEGSVAIGLGRAAGLAKLAGLEKTASALWAKLENLGNGAAKAGDMPNLDQLHAAYQANPDKFAAFADKGNFPAEGAAFSNAAGSYAFGLDYKNRGSEATKNGGDAKWIGHWAAEALRAGGFEKQAASMEQLEAQPAKVWTASIVDTKDTNLRVM